MFGKKVQNLKASLSCFRTTAKVLIFESDDWGLDRMPSREVYDELASAGAIDTDNPFNKCARETVEDLGLLYDVLAEFRDCTGRPPVFTVNFVVANPDYEAIEESGFRKYSWIAIDDVDRRPELAALLAKYNEGVERGLIYPQYHGRDHFSAESWLGALRSGDPVARVGFRHGVPIAGGSRVQCGEYMRSNGQAVMALHRAAIDAKTEAGIDVFRRVFGFRSLTSIAPFYRWCDAVESSLYQQGVRCMQAAGHRISRCDGDGPVRLGWNVLGVRSEPGMTYLIRNGWFRPSEVGEAALGSCMREVVSAFARGYPAVIDTHRLNYVGTVDLAMRNANVRLLRELLREILRRFPEVRFATSAELASSLLGGPGQFGGGRESALLIPRASIVRRASFAARERYEWWLGKKRSPGHREHPARKATH